MRARAQTPYVQIVDVQHSFHGAHASSYFSEANTTRQTLQEDVERLANDVPGSPNDQDTDQDGEDRIDPQPTGVPDGDCACDDGDRSERIAQEVNESAANVDVILAGAAQGEHDAAIQQQAKRRDRN